MYVLFWPKTAIDRLTLAYLAAVRDDRSEAFRRSIDALEALLAVAPAGQGESRVDPMRIVYRLPAGILFRVDEAALAVVVLDVIYVSR